MLVVVLVSRFCCKTYLIYLMYFYKCWSDSSLPVTALMMAKYSPGDLIPTEFGFVFLDSVLIPVDFN